MKAVWAVWMSMLSLSFSMAQPQGDSLDTKVILRLDTNLQIIDFQVDDEGNLLIVDGQNRLQKYLVAESFDSVIVVGGRGVREEGFLNPVKIVARNRQSTYVLDQGLQRIALFNTNLKLIGETDFLQIENLADWLGVGETIQPISFDVNAAGEKFILNAQDNRVYRIDNFGDISKAFGGIDYGEGSLFDPVDLQIDASNQVWVSDTSEQALYLYNLYGIFQEYIAPAVPFRWTNFQLGANKIFFYNEKRLFVYATKTQKGKALSFISPVKSLQKLISSQGKLYLLIGNEVHLQTY